MQESKDTEKLFRFLGYGVKNLSQINFIREVRQHKTT